MILVDLGDPGGPPVHVATLGSERNMTRYVGVPGGPPLYVGTPKL